MSHTNTPMCGKALVFRENENKIGSESCLQLGGMEMRKEPLWKGSICDRLGGSNLKALFCQFDCTSNICIDDIPTLGAFTNCFGNHSYSNIMSFCNHVMQCLMLADSMTTP